MPVTIVTIGMVVQEKYTFPQATLICSYFSIFSELQPAEFSLEHLAKHSYQFPQALVTTEKPTPQRKSQLAERIRPVINLHVDVK